MTMRRAVSRLVALCLAATAVAALAQQQPAQAQQAAPQPGSAEDIAQRIISVPNPRGFAVIGAQGQIRDDAGVQGGHALRIPVPGRSDQPWSVSVSVPINRAVHAGDNLILAFWARLETGENGAETTVLPFNAVQLASAPYTAIFNGPLTISHNWQIQEIRGRADRDYDAGAINVAIHLATARQVVDIGPVFVVNMGQSAPAN
ncbi:hypothetical protein GCM10023232_10900 [Sphingosinicella ginsenosidimutans]|uniref:CBM-cenC domain-containing protein n=1 Tax=Allosphingosinicella ginsenosidimutans TaxID=1176539 RepID=A0A5C6TP58_9SPHN|nr:hypothetical protein [Sphingosinicella ginsenosidimutans]TXC62203.1 hypothetical protein FRZ32_00190 [Sphingosinicella ginsenosidimutans]